MISRYVARQGLAPDKFGAVYAFLGAQRALRILGIFARLCHRDGRVNYLRFVPRVWRALLRDLDHPALSDLRRAVLLALPEPTPERLHLMRERSCSPSL